MTTMETIAAAAVAILGTWLLWPCLLVTAVLLFLGFMAGVLALQDWWETRKKNHKKGPR